MFHHFWNRMIGHQSKTTEDTTNESSFYQIRKKYNFTYCNHLVSQINNTCQEDTRIHIAEVRRSGERMMNAACNVVYNVSSFSCILIFDRVGCSSCVNMKVIMHTVAALTGWAGNGVMKLYIHRFPQSNGQSVSLSLAVGIDEIRTVLKSRKPQRVAGRPEGGSYIQVLPGWVPLVKEDVKPWVWNHSVVKKLWVIIAMSKSA